GKRISFSNVNKNKSTREIFGLRTFWILGLSSFSQKSLFTEQLFPRNTFKKTPIYSQWRTTKESLLTCTAQEDVLPATELSPPRIMPLSKLLLLMLTLLLAEPLTT
ncbi:hypothetical protein WDU94_005802, partial [Cyamophila willieti]